MPEMKSMLAAYSDELRRRIREQSADTKMQQEAFLELFCDHYDTLLEALAEQIDRNTADIAALREAIEVSGESGVQGPLTEDKEAAIQTLLDSNTVTPVGLSEPAPAPQRDEFDELDELAVRGDLDEEARPRRSRR